ncbi:hypothetical protein PAMP_021214 [Pampus punctatissimus]
MSHGGKATVSLHAAASPFRPPKLVVKHSELQEYNFRWYKKTLPKTKPYTNLRSNSRESKKGADMSGGDVVCSGWLRKSPPEKKLRRYLFTVLCASQSVE